MDDKFRFIFVCSTSLSRFRVVRADTLGEEACSFVQLTIRQTTIGLHSCATLTHIGSAYIAQLRDRSAYIDVKRRTSTPPRQLIITSGGNNRRMKGAKASPANLEAWQ
jgi:hypothetical protein